MFFCSSYYIFCKKRLLTFLSSDAFGAEILGEVLSVVIFAKAVIAVYRHVRHELHKFQLICKQL